MIAVTLVGLAVAWRRGTLQRKMARAAGGFRWPFFLLCISVHAVSHFAAGVESAAGDARSCNFRGAGWGAGSADGNLSSPRRYGLLHAERASQSPVYASLHFWQ